MHMTTTQEFQGHHIDEYYGVVCAEAILGASFVKDWFARITDVVGGRSSSYETELAKARETAFQELEKRAQKLGANAIVGMDIDYEVLGERNGMLMVSVSGTAVRIRED